MALSEDDISAMVIDDDLELVTSWFDLSVPDVAISPDERTDCMTINLEIPFASCKHANIAFNTLRIDAEPPRGNVVKELDVRNNLLLVKMSSNEAKKLRTAVSAFMDYVILVIKVIGRFGETDTDSSDDCSDNE